ncbi:MerR family transcriptional regulator [Pantoea sp. A4]|uniref:MerR family transcriptional regulator n=1 Tax=Pantoea sp. A4 TaxID=1225184 RepID=UPI00037FEB36|nr:MerR family transcriptional regulator [Pantoea sp. A4]
MRIGELSASTGISERMLRYYEQEKLLSPKRSAAGYREYSLADKERVERIRLLNSSGVKIESIRLLLPCMLDDGNGFSPCKIAIDILQQEVQKLEAKLQEFTESKRIVEDFLNTIE